jgi:hypothetical protein
MKSLTIYQEPLTPETNQRPLTHGSGQVRHVGHRRERNSSINVELEAGSAPDESDTEDAPKKLRSQTPLWCHRGVQTDPQGSTAGLSPGQTSYGDQVFLPSPNDGHSESSSLVDNPSTLGALLERIQQLFNRIAQTDARTLTTRLKRQNILGADVGYLSRSTVDGIIAEVTNLRVVLRAALEDDKFTTICTRRDLRTLLKLFRDIFRELGTVRTTLNDIVLDPSIAPRVREMTLNSKDEPSSSGKFLSSNPGGRWMAPFSKLFGGPVSNERRGVTPLGVNQGRGPALAPSRPIPKLGPAISASTTTVNVEFTGTGAGRAVTNSATPIVQKTVHNTIAAPVATRSTSIMDIFAGAPDSWVVLPPDFSQQTGVNADQPRRTAHKRTASRMMAATDKTQSSLPRNVDAVIDPHNSPEERGGIDPARTLRRRGLSESSIHTTFLQHGSVAAQPPGPSETAGGRTVLGALRRTIPNARSTVSGTMSPETLASPPGSAKELSQSRATSPRFTGILADMSSWAAASRALDDPDPDLYVGSVISNSPMRPWDRRGEL